MVDTKNKPNEDTKPAEETSKQRAKKLEHIALYKSTGKSEWSLYPQMFTDKKQAELKLELTVRPAEVHIVKLELPG